MTELIKMTPFSLNLNQLKSKLTLGANKGEYEYARKLCTK